MRKKKRRRKGNFSINEFVNKMWYINTIGYYSATKYKLFIYPITCTKHERHQTQKTTYNSTNPWNRKQVTSFPGSLPPPLPPARHGGTDWEWARRVQDFPEGWWSRKCPDNCDVVHFKMVRMSFAGRRLKQEDCSSQRPTGNTRQRYAILSQTDTNQTW